MKMAFRLLALVLLGAQVATVAGQPGSTERLIAVHPMPAPNGPTVTIIAPALPVASNAMPVANTGVIAPSCPAPCGPACQAPCTQTSCCLEPRTRITPVYNSCREQLCRTHGQCGLFLTLCG